MRAWRSLEHIPFNDQLCEITVVDQHDKFLMAVAKYREGKFLGLEECGLEPRYWREADTPGDMHGWHVFDEKTKMALYHNSAIFDAWVRRTHYRKNAGERHVPLLDCVYRRVANVSLSFAFKNNKIIPSGKELEAWSINPNDEILAYIPKDECLDVYRYKEITTTCYPCDRTLVDIAVEHNNKKKGKNSIKRTLDVGTCPNKPYNLSYEIENTRYSITHFRPVTFPSLY
jgi:hypothetical protein